MSAFIHQKSVGLYFPPFRCVRRAPAVVQERRQILWFQPMFMKQDIWDIYFQTHVRNGFNVPEPADHHSLIWVSLRRCGEFGAARGGRGRLWGLREGEGDELLQ